MSLMTYKEYKKKEHAMPYELVVQAKNNRSLYCFGEKHSFDPNHPQWKQQEKLWHSFLVATTDHKRIVFVEGGKRRHRETKEESIVRDGGMGLATYLASQEDIETFSPEPEEQYIRGELEKKFSREHIQYYYFARVALQWHRQDDSMQESFEDYVGKFLQMDGRESGWQDFDFSLDHMQQIHTDTFETPFDKNDADFFYNTASPTITKSPINEVSRTTGILRDTFIVQQVKKYIDDGYSIYMQYGWSHIVMQEPLLRKLLLEK